VPSGVERAFSEELLANVREHAWGRRRRRHGRALRWSAFGEGRCLCCRRLRRSLRGGSWRRLLLLAQLVFWPLPLPLPLPLPAPFSLLPACLVMRRSMKEGRAAAAPARKATGAKSTHWRTPHPPIATGRDVRSLTMPVLPSSSMARSPAPRYPLSQLPSRARSGASRRSVWRIRGHLRGMHTAAGGIFVGARTPWASRRRLACGCALCCRGRAGDRRLVDACDDSGRGFGCFLVACCFKRHRPHGGGGGYYLPRRLVAAISAVLRQPGRGLL
jgi:hypothetical protein